MFTEAELKTRQLGIGGSEAAAVLGLSRRTTENDVCLYPPDISMPFSPVYNVGCFL